MRPQPCSILLLIGLVLAVAPARAEPPACSKPLGSRFGLCDVRQWLRCWCPDDYCTKPLPCVACVLTGCVDDYCPKELPGVPCCPRGCVDDYCPKNCPLGPGKLCEPWYTCGPINACGCKK